MPTTDAVFAVSNAVITLLRTAYPAELHNEHPCEFRLMSSGELANLNNINTTLSLFLYRLSQNEHRQPQQRRAADLAPLALNLHFLLTVWSTSAMAEQRILTWAMDQLYRNPTLSRANLSATAGWRADDVVQLIPAELSTEDLMRIWDALEPPYRLSVPYTARVVRIEPAQEPDNRPVVATRFDYTASDARAEAAP